MVDVKVIPILVEALTSYYDVFELKELASVYDIHLSYGPRGNAYLNIVKGLVENIERGNNRLFVDNIVEQLMIRADRNVAEAKWEKQDFHLRMKAKIIELKQMLGEPALSGELHVPEAKPFAAKSEMREFLGNLETPVTIVDPYIGAGTLDCLRDVDKPIRILTGTRSQSIEQGFERVLSEFIQEGYQIEIHRHPRLHDRYILFNDRCWLVGSSLKDAGNKSFNCIEMIDGKLAISNEIEQKWNEADAYP